MSVSEFKPCCGTPLYEAIEQSVTYESRKINTSKTHLVYVTIITDGYANHSRRQPQVKSLVSECCAKNTWFFMFMGPPSSRSFASSISISNVIEFNPNPAEMLAVLEKERHSRSEVFREVDSFALSRGLILSPDDFQRELVQLVKITITPAIAPNSRRSPPPSAAPEVPVNWSLVNKLDMVHKLPFVSLSVIYRHTVICPLI